MLLLFFSYTNSAKLRVESQNSISQIDVIKKQGLTSNLVTLL